MPTTTRKPTKADVVKGYASPNKGSEGYHWKAGYGPGGKLPGYGKVSGTKIEPKKPKSRAPTAADVKAGRARESTSGPTWRKGQGPAGPTTTRATGSFVGAGGRAVNTAKTLASGTKASPKAGNGYSGSIAGLGVKPANVSAGDWEIVRRAYMQGPNSQARKDMENFLKSRAGTRGR